MHRVCVVARCAGFLGEALQKEFTENKSFLMSMTLEAGDVTDGGGKGAV